EEEHGDGGAAASRHRQRMPEAIEEEVAVRQSRERVVHRLVLGAVLGPAPLDRVRQHVGDRLHEADFLGTESVSASRAGFEHAVWLVLGLDQNDRGAAKSVIDLKRRRVEPGLLADVADDRCQPGRECVSGLRAIAGGHDDLADQLAGHSLCSDQQELVTARLELEDHAEPDLQTLRQDPASLLAELVYVRALERKLTEARDLTLLGSLRSARSFAACECLGGLGQLRSPARLDARLPASAQGHADGREQAEAPQRQAAPYSEGEDEEGREIEEPDRDDRGRCIRDRSEEKGEDQEQHVWALRASVEAGGERDQRDQSPRPGDEEGLTPPAANDALQRERPDQRRADQP